MGDALRVKTNECTDFSEREALRAVLAFHRDRRRRHQRRPYPPEVSLERLNTWFERPPSGGSIRKRLIDCAVKANASAFTTDQGSLDELRYFVGKGLPVVVGMWSRRSTFDQASPPSITSNRTHFAVVVAVGADTITLLCPQQGEHTDTELAIGASIPIAEFKQRWVCVDDDDDGDNSTIRQVAAWYMVLNFDNREFAPRLKKGKDAMPPDRRRRRGVQAAVASIVVGVVLLSVESYRDPKGYTAPLLAIALSVIGFALVDFFARPEKRRYTSGLIPRWYRAWLPFWCLVPFFTAIGGSVWVHYEKWQEARADVRQLASEVKASVEWPDDDSASKKVDAASGPGSPNATAPRACKNHDQSEPEPIASIIRGRCWFAVDPATDACWMSADLANIETRGVLLGANAESNLTRELSKDVREDMAAKVTAARTWNCFTTERVNAKVAMLVETRYRDDKTSDEAKRFEKIARVIGHDVLIARGDIEVVCTKIAGDTGFGFALAIAVQALFVLWVPVLLAVAIGRAQSRVKRSHTRLMVNESIELRDHKILAEDQYLFLPRMCFAILLVLGTNYVFAPLGLKATYIMSIVDEHALPGHTTFTLWSTSFSEAPVIVVGFVGFLIYALITATQRFSLDDFDDRAMLSLLVRGLIVILLSFALSSPAMNEFASRTFVFIAGVFPIRALDAIAKKVNVTIDPDFAPGDQGTGFSGLPGLDPIKVSALRAAGIQSTYDLAAMNVQDVAERVRIDPRLLGRAVDRAILIDALGLTLTEELGGFGITSATELIDTDLSQLIAPATPPANPKGTEPSVLFRAADAAKARLSFDHRVKTVRGWLAAGQDEK